MTEPRQTKPNGGNSLRQLLGAGDHGGRALKALLLLACVVHVSVLIEGYFGLGWTGVETTELLFTIITGAGYVVVRRGGRRAQLLVAHVMWIAVCGRWATSWLFAPPNDVYVSTVSGLLYLPLLIASGMLLGMQQRTCMVVISVMGALATYGATRADLAQSVLSDWRIGPAMAASGGLLVYYLSLWLNQQTQLVSARQRTGKLEVQAMTDALTGLMNRRGAEALLGHYADAGRRATLMLIDIDHFKKVNDEHGHDVGDQTLKLVAEVLRLSFPAPAECVRWGGEELVVIVPGDDLEQAVAAADQFRRRFTHRCLATLGFSVTASVGVTRWDAFESPAVGLKRADQALYAAKEGGRDQTRVAERRA